MPRNIRIHLPDGTTHTYVGVPDSVTTQQLNAQVQKDFGAHVSLQGNLPPASRPAAKPAPLPKTSTGGALWRGIEDAVPFKNYLQAAANEAGSKLGLNNTPSSMSYLDRVRALKGQGDTLEEADRQQHPIAHYTGEAGGIVLGGGGIGAGVKAVATRVAPRAAAVVANVLQRSLAARTAAASAGGAAGGATYAAGDANPEDAGTEALKGGAGGLVAGVAAPAAAKYVAKPLLGLGARAVQWLSAPFTDAIKNVNASRVLGNITSASSADLARAADDFRAHNSGAEPTLFQLLPLADRNAIINKVVAGRDNLIEQSQGAIDAHTAKVGSQMASHIDSVLQPQRENIHAGILNDLRTARGGQLEPGDVDLAHKAMSNSTDMDALRKTEADAYMAPHKDTQVAENFSDILPQAPVNTGKTVKMVETDPAVSQMIRNLTPAGYRSSGQGVNVGDIAGDLIPSLHDIKAKGGMEGAIANRAIEHLQGVLADTSPDVAAAQQAMNDAYAARSRMIEGMNAGDDFNLRNDIGTGPGAGINPQLVRNQYDTPEGQAGLLLGTHNQLSSNLAGSPKQAAATIAALSDGTTGRQLENNFGSDAANQIITGAQDQNKGLQALRVASGQMGSGGADDSGQALAAIGQAATIAHPYFSPATKIKAITKLAASFNIPENRARTILDMAFSGDPAMQQRAIAALGPKGPAYLQSLAGTSVAAGRVGADQTAGTPPPPVAPQTQLPDMPQIDAGGAPAAAPGAETMPELPQIDGAPTDGGQPAADPAQSPYAAMLDHYKATENPDVVALGQRMWGQESGHRQFDPKTGRPITSKKGAIGLAQVMPHTAPEAAAYAGLPWDPHAYQSDPAYNELLGYAYLSKQLIAHGGDPAKAAASYNAGPTRTDMSLRTGAPLPAETQDYVQRVAS